MAINLIGTDRGPLYQYPQEPYGPLGPFYRVSAFTTSASWAITLEVENTYGVPMEAVSDAPEMLSGDLVIAAGDTGFVTITATLGPAPAAAFITESTLSWAFVLGPGEEAPEGDGAFFLFGRIGRLAGGNLANGYPTAGLGHIWFPLADPLSGYLSVAAGASAFYPDDDAVAPTCYTLPAYSGGAPPSYVTSMSVTNVAGGWSVEMDRWWDDDAEVPDGAVWGPVVKYNGPPIDSWTWVDLTIRDDVGRQAEPVSPPFSTTQAVGGGTFDGPVGALWPDPGIDETTYPASVAIKTIRLIAYVGELPTLPSGGGIFAGYPIGAAGSGLVAIGG